MSSSLEAERSVREARLLSRRTSRQPEAVPPRGHPDRHALSPAQAAICNLTDPTAGSPAWHVQTLLEVTGSLRPDDVRSALQEVVRRHEPLRTRLSRMDDGSWQAEVANFIEPRWRCLDPRQEAQPASEDAVSALVREWAVLPLLPVEGPGLALQLIRTGDSRWVLHLVAHHLWLDGWSLTQVVEEMGALVSGRSLPDPGNRTYGDWAEQEACRPRSPTGPNKSGPRAAPILTFPSARALPVRSARGGERMQFRLSAALQAGLSELAARHGVSLFCALLTTALVLWSRLAGVEKVTSGVPVAGRTRAAEETLVGMFVQTVPISTEILPEQAFSALLTQVHDLCLDRLHSVEPPAVEPPQVLFNFHNHPVAMAQFAGRDTRMLPLPSPGAMLDYRFDLWPTSDGLIGFLEYDSEKYPPHAARQMIDCYETLLVQAVQDAGRPVGSFTLLSPEEQTRVLAMSEGPALTAEPAVCPVDQILRQAARAPGARAVAGTDTTWSYAELVEHVQRIAAGLRAVGVGPGRIVGLHAGRTPALIAAILAVQHCGAAYLPLDPAYPTERLRFYLEDSGADTVITDRDPADLRGGLLWLSLEQLLRTECPVPSPSLAEPEGAAYLLYTSGSTGTPKGVPIRHVSVSALMCWARRTFSREDLAGVLASTSLGFDLSVFEIFAPLSCGGALILVDTLLDWPDSPASQDVTLVNTVPSLLRELLNQGELPCLPRVAVLCGEFLAQELVERTYSRGVGGVYDVYGPTEDTVYSTCTLREMGGEPTIGVSLPGSRAYVLEPGGTLAPPGLAGELYLGGIGLSAG